MFTKKIKFKEFIEGYANKISEYNVLIDEYNIKLKTCLGDLWNLISTQYYYDRDASKQIKQENEIISCYIKNRQKLDKIDDKLDDVVDEINSKFNKSLSEKQLKKLKQVYPLKKIINLNDVISNLYREINEKEMEGYVGDDEEGYFDRTVSRDYKGIAINKDLINQIEVEFNLNINSRSNFTKKIYNREDLENSFELK